MADKKLTTLDAITSLTSDDLFYIVDAPGSTPVSKKITAGNAAGSLATLANALTGSGTLNFLAKFTGSGATLGNSNITDNGTTVGLGVATATTLNGNTFTTGTYTLTGTAGKTLNFTNSLTFIGTDSSSVAFGAGGTVLYSGGSLFTLNAGSGTGLTVPGAVTQGSTVTVGSNTDALMFGSLALGFGSTTPPSGPTLNVVSTLSTSPRGIASMQFSTDTNGARVGFFKARGTVASPTTVVTGDTLGRLMFRGYDGTGYLEMASIEVISTGTIATNRVPTQLIFQTATNATPSVLTTAMTIGADQNITAANGLTLSAGQVTLPTGSTSTPSINFGNSNTGIYANGANTIAFTIANSEYFRISSGAIIYSFVDQNIFSNTGRLLFGNAGDAIIRRLATANLAIGNTASASPVANTLTIGESSRGGTDSNVAGASGTIQSGTGTGTGTVATLIFQTPTLGSSGTTTQSYATRLTLSSTAATFTVPLVASGTATNDNAAAGNIGEYTSGTIASGSAVSLTSATPTNVTSVSLTAGDWNVWGVVDYVTTGATTSDFKSGISSTSATFGAQDTFQNMPFIATALSDTFGHAVALTRISLASTTTVYLVGQSNFSVGTAAAYGSIFARRVR